jgi:hypothetical protein
MLVYYHIRKLDQEDQTKMHLPPPDLTISGNNRSKACAWLGSLIVWEGSSRASISISLLGVQVWEIFEGITHIIVPAQYPKEAGT